MTPAITLWEQCALLPFPSCSFTPFHAGSWRDFFHWPFQTLFFLQNEHCVCSFTWLNQRQPCSLCRAGVSASPPGPPAGPCSASTAPGGVGEDCKCKQRQALFCAIASKEYFCWEVHCWFLFFFLSQIYTVLFSAEKSLHEIQLFFFKHLLCLLDDPSL